MQGPFSNIKLELEDIPSEAYFFNEEDKKFWCTKCNYSTPRLDKVIQHIKAHLYSKWRCDECGKAFIKVSYTQLCIKISLMKVSMPIKHRCSYAKKARFGSVVGALHCVSIGIWTKILPNKMSPSGKPDKMSRIHQHSLYSSQQQVSSHQSSPFIVSYRTATAAVTARFKGSWVSWVLTGSRGWYRWSERNLPQ